MDWKLKNKPEAKISEESAQAQVFSLLEFYQIDVESLPADRRPNLEFALDKLAGFVRQGLVEIQAPKVIHHLKNPPGAVPAIEYGEVGGINTVAMDRRDPKDTYGRIYELLGSLSGLGADAIQALKGVDLIVAENVGVLFQYR